MFYGPGLFFGGAECVGSRFQVLRALICFRRYRGRRVPFSSFALPYSFSAVPSASGLVFKFGAPDSFSAVPRASGPFFLFCAPGVVFGGPEGVGSRFQVFAPRLIFGGDECVGSRFHVLCARSHFRRYRWRRISFSCFALPMSFSAVPRTSGHVFKFCAPELVFGGAVCVGSRFHVLRALTHFWRYRGRRVPFSRFARPKSFSTVPRASGPVFTFCAPGLIFDGTEGIGSRFHVLRSLTRFRRYGGRPVPFSCFAVPDSFSAVRRASGPVLRARSRFRWYRWRRVPFSCFALPDSFWTIPRASGPVFMFCAPGLVFSGTGGVGSRFQVLRARTHFRRFRGRRVPFSRFALPYSFSVVPSASGPVFMFCAP
jgi:hypothetical protein